MDACTCVTTNTGRILRPKDSDRLILYLKDVNLPKPDKYDTIQLIAFLQQIITYKGKNIERINAFVEDGLILCLMLF